MEQQNALKNAPETPAEIEAPKATKRVVVTVDASKAGDPAAAREAALLELQRQVKADKEAKARKHAKNVKTLEDNARWKLYPMFFPAYHPGPEKNKTLVETFRTLNKKLLDLRGQFTTAMNEGKVKDALAILVRAVEVQNGNLIEPRQGPIWNNAQGGQKDGQGEGR